MRTASTLLKRFDCHADTKKRLTRRSITETIQIFGPIMTGAEKIRATMMSIGAISEGNINIEIRHEHYLDQEQLDQLIEGVREGRVEHEHSLILDEQQQRIVRLAEMMAPETLTN